MSAAEGDGRVVSDETAALMLSVLNLREAAASTSFHSAVVSLGDVRRVLAHLDAERARVRAALAAAVAGERARCAYEFAGYLSAREVLPPTRGDAYGWQYVAREYLAAPSPNQCDGCARGLPADNGLHRDADGRAYMSCTADRYAAPSPPAGARVSPVRECDYWRPIEPRGIALPCNCGMGCDGPRVFATPPRAVTLSPDEEFALSNAMCVLASIAQDDAHPAESLDPRMSAFDTAEHLLNVLNRVRGIAKAPAADATAVTPPRAGDEAGDVEEAVRAAVELERQRFSRAVGMMQLRATQLGASAEVHRAIGAYREGVPAEEHIAAPTPDVVAVDAAWQQATSGALVAYVSACAAADAADDDDVDALGRAVDARDAVLAAIRAYGDALADARASAPCPHVTTHGATRYCTLPAALRLTDEEKDALVAALDFFDGCADVYAAALRGLLARTTTPEHTR